MRSADFKEVTIAVNSWFDMKFDSPYFAYYTMLRKLVGADCSSAGVSECGDVGCRDCC
jgi:hypothetical protein